MQPIPILRQVQKFIFQIMGEHPGRIFQVPYRIFQRIKLFIKQAVMAPCIWVWMLVFITGIIHRLIGLYIIVDYPMWKFLIWKSVIVIRN